jgi:nucleotide-binding universal stress UspA family protein
VDEVCSRRWPPGSRVKVLAVAHTRVPTVIDPFLVTTMIHFDVIEHEKERMAKLVADVAEQIHAKTADLEIEREVVEGSPERVIVEEAGRWHADLIIIGSHGYGLARRLLLGSVSNAVSAAAPCSVEIVKTSHVCDEASNASAASSPRQTAAAPRAAHERS